MKNFSYTGYELLWLFLIYSFLGWCSGVAVAAVKQKRFVNTGVLNLPFCPVYGVSAILYSVFLSELREQLLFLFAGGAILTAALTVLTGAVLEHIFHRKWRDYSEYRFGFGGHITLPLILIFGVLAVVILRLGNPLFLRVIGLMPDRFAEALLYVLLAAMAIDLSGVLAVVWKWRRHIIRVAVLTENMQQVSLTFGNAITTRIQRRLEKSYPNIASEKLLKIRAQERAQKYVVFAQGLGFYKLFWLFFIGSFLGAMVEMVFCRVRLGWWMSRSSLVYGQFSIVWGFACALLTIFLHRYRSKSDRFIFFYGTVVGGAYEYICSVLSEMMFGTVFWDYSKIPFNLGGRINLLYCFFWGFAAVIWLKGVYPFLTKWIEKIPRRAGGVITWILVAFMVFNMALSALALGRYAERQREAEPSNVMEQMLDERFPDERMARVYPKARFVR